MKAQGIVGSSRRALLATFVGLLAVAGAPPVLAQQSQPVVGLIEEHVLGKGYDPTKGFAVGELDTVNTFNGNLTLRLPLGPSYTGSGGFGFQLTLTYNSNAWEFRTIYDDEGPENGPAPEDCFRMAQQAIPIVDANAGLGWKVSLGELYPPGGIWLPQRESLEERIPNRTPYWVFIAPDGSRHTFDSTLHPNANLADLYAQNAAYTRDGSHLRLHDHAELTKIVSTPDGMRYWFTKADPLAFSGAGRWQLTQVVDPNGNFLNVKVNSTSATEEVWTLEEREAPSTLLRRHKLTFHKQPLDPAQAGETGLHFRRLLKQVALAGAEYGDDPLQSNPEPTLIYDFKYAWSDAILPPPGHEAKLKNCGDPRLGAGEICATSRQVWSDRPQDMRLLTKVTLPADKENGDRPTFEFTYQNDAGLLTSMKVPTGGKVSWAWRGWQMPNEGAFVGQGPLPQGGMCPVHLNFFDSNLGVEARTTFDPVTQIENQAPLEERTTRYGQRLRLNFEGPNGHPARDTETLVLGPNTGAYRSATVHHYSVFLGGDETVYSGDVTDPNPQEVLGAEPWDHRDFGLPFTRRELSNLEGEPVYLSTERFRCPANFEADFQTVRSSCRKEQAEFVRYEQDQTACPSLKDCQFNSRIKARETHTYEYGTSGMRTEYLRTDYSSWDGLGHYRRMKTRGSSYGAITYTATQVDQWPARVEHTSYNAGTGEVLPNAFPGPGAVPTPGEKWILNLFKEKWVAQDVYFLRSDFSSSIATKHAELSASLSCFDSSGRLTGVRVLSSMPRSTRAENLDSVPTKQPYDLITTFVYDSKGNLVEEKFHGGDGAGLGSQDCSAGGNPQYRRAHAYSEGVRTSTTIQDALGNPKLQVFKLEELNHLGQARRSIGTNGLETVAKYDRLGRFIELEPAEEAATTWTYSNFSSATSPARVEVFRGGSSTERSEIAVDGFGRAYRTRTLLPGGSENETETFYYANGAVRFQTVVHARNDTHQIAAAEARRTTTTYDGLGRDHQVTAPDGTGALYTYEGTRVTEHEAGPDCDTTPTACRNTRQAYRVFTKDPFGNLVGVAERSDAGALVATLYRYDTAGRLTVVQHPPLSGVSGNQRRIFDYDGRGFLLHERHPEIDGEITRTEFDALGNAKSWQLADGSGPGEKLRFYFDALGRLVQIRDETRLDSVDPSRGRLVKELYYDPAIGGSIEPWRSAGLLVEAKRHNWFDRYDPQTSTSKEEDVIVTEWTAYDGIGGRPSQRGTRTTTGASYVVGVQYDDHGNVVQVGYPTCRENADCATGVGISEPSRTLTFAYAAGLPTQIDSAAFQTKLKYHPSLLLHEVAYTGAATWRQTADPSGIARPNKIETLGVTGNPTPQGHGGNLVLGPYAYDASGNPTSIGGPNGADAFVYDTVPRLVDATVAFPGGSRHLQYTYDAVGNIRQVVEDGQSQNVLVDGATNRLVGTCDGGPLYDRRGNQLCAGGLTLTYDALGMVSSAGGSGVNKEYLYTPNEERLRVIDYVVNPLPGQADLLGPLETWTLRGFDNQVLRVSTERLGIWSWDQDYLYAGSRRLATVQSQAGGVEEQRHFHPDHLGSPRLVTDGNGKVLQYHEYLPFGEEATVSGGDKERMRFTGHERDFNCEEDYCDPAGRDDLDYMHARYYSAENRRFLSPDLILGEAEAPQSWNRYSYVNNRPSDLIDPEGLVEASPEPYSLEWYAIRAAEELDSALEAGVEKVKEAYHNYKEDRRKRLEQTLPDWMLPESLEGKVTWGYVEWGFMTAASVSMAGVGEAPPAGGPAPRMGAPRTYQTYTKTHPESGAVYTGRTSGTGTPLQNVARRDAGHHMNGQGYGPAVLDQSSSNAAAIRGREQILIDANGGARSMGGTSGNAINGISPSNPSRAMYLSEAEAAFNRAAIP